MVVYDKQPDGAYPAVSTLIQSIKQDGTTSSTSLDNLNLDNKDRFVVLRDLRYKLTGHGSGDLYQQDSSGVLNKWIVDEYIPLKLAPTVYSASASTGTVTDIQTGNIFLFLLGSNAAGATSLMEFQYSARYRYLDA